MLRIPSELWSVVVAPSFLGIFLQKGLVDFSKQIATLKSHIYKFWHLKTSESLNVDVNVFKCTMIINKPTNLLESGLKTTSRCLECPSWIPNVRHTHKKNSRQKRKGVWLGTNLTQLHQFCRSKGPKFQPAVCGSLWKHLKFLHQEIHFKTV